MPNLVDLEALKLDVIKRVFVDLQSALGNDTNWQSAYGNLSTRRTADLPRIIDAISDAFYDNVNLVNNSFARAIANTPGRPRNLESLYSELAHDFNSNMVQSIKTTVGDSNIGGSMQLRRLDRTVPRIVEAHKMAKQALLDLTSEHLTGAELRDFNLERVRHDLKTLSGHINKELEARGLSETERADLIDRRDAVHNLSKAISGNIDKFESEGSREHLINLKKSLGNNGQNLAEVLSSLSKPTPVNLGTKELIESLQQLATPSAPVSTVTPLSPGEVTERVAKVGGELTGKRTSRNLVIALSKLTDLNGNPLAPEQKLQVIEELVEKGIINSNLLRGGAMSWITAKRQAATDIIAATLANAKSVVVDVDLNIVKRLAREVTNRTSSSVYDAIAKLSEQGEITPADAKSLLKYFYETNISRTGLIDAAMSTDRNAKNDVMKKVHDKLSAKVGGYLNKDSNKLTDILDKTEAGRYRLPERVLLFLSKPFRPGIDLKTRLLSAAAVAAVLAGSYYGTSMGYNMLFTKTPSAVVSNAEDIEKMTGVKDLKKSFADAGLNEGDTRGLYAQVKMLNNSDEGKRLAAEFLESFKTESNLGKLKKDLSDLIRYIHPINLKGEKEPFNLWIESERAGSTEKRLIFCRQIDGLSIQDERYKALADKYKILADLVRFSREDGSSLFVLLKQKSDESRSDNAVIISATIQSAKTAKLTPGQILGIWNLAMNKPTVNKGYALGTVEERVVVLKSVMGSAVKLNKKSPAELNRVLSKYMTNGIPDFTKDPRDLITELDEALTATTTAKASAKEAETQFKESLSSVTNKSGRSLWDYVNINVKTEQQYAVAEAVSKIIKNLVSLMLNERTDIQIWDPYLYNHVLYYLNTYVKKDGQYDVSKINSKDFFLFLAYHTSAYEDKNPTQNISGLRFKFDAEKQTATIGHWLFAGQLADSQNGRVNLSNMLLEYANQSDILELGERGIKLDVPFWNYLKSLTSKDFEALKTASKWEDALIKMAGMTLEQYNELKATKTGAEAWRYLQINLKSITFTQDEKTVILNSANGEAVVNILLLKETPYAVFKKFVDATK